MMMTMILSKAREKFPQAALIMKHAVSEKLGDIYKIMTYKRHLIAYAWEQNGQPGFIELVKEEEEKDPWIEALEAAARARYDVENSRLSNK